MKSRKTVTIMIALIAAVLLIFTAHIRVIQIADQAVLLLDNPFFHGSSSVGNDIRKAFIEAGKASDSILDIVYIGTNSDGNYFECTYQETDDSVRTYYAFDDGDLNSTVRAKVLWEEP